MTQEEELKFKNRRELIQSFYLSFDKKYMLLGYTKEDEIIFIPKNQDSDIEIVLNPDDEFIFIKY